MQKESELPIEELLKTLPKEVLENPVPAPSDGVTEVNFRDFYFLFTPSTLPWCFKSLWIIFLGEIEHL